MYLLNLIEMKKETTDTLKHKNIDTGMGLERMACIMQGVDNIFEVDTIKHILNAVEKIAGVRIWKRCKN